MIVTFSPETGRIAATPPATPPRSWMGGNSTTFQMIFIWS